MGMSPSEVLEAVNDSLISHNEAEMFVTVWIGILEISTGKLTAANAGHEYPAIKRPGGKYELFKDKHGFVIGGMDGMTYKEYELQLEPGTSIFVYTDGVPESTNKDDVMFGTDRMVDALNIEPDACPEKVLENMSESIDEFVQDAEQFDDLTMLCIKYNGPES
jgi:sigma-B regulation protein RsbU (phosphoserine phosphatase)